MKHIGTERDYQRYIIDYLIENNGYIERKCKTNYDRTTAMDRELLFRFLDTTQPDTMAALRKIYNGQTEETIVKFILQSIDNKGSSLIETLKSGIEISNMHLDLLYGKPATDYNIDLVAKYNANIFSVMEEVWINDDQRIDLVVFLNGFAIATFELKCQAAGQNYRMAIKQYSEDRDPKNRLFLFKAGALVNFAMDLDTCYMTTKLDGLGTRFIPFNRGRGEGVNTGEGNPLDDGVDDYPMHYMWDDILRRDSLIELITKFVFIQREQVVDELTGKKSVKEKLIFPRYHQRDAVRQLLADAEYNGTQLNYLIEHSAGSGKTNTIAWLAHRLVSLHDTQNQIIYDSVLVITDRVVVDRQLQDAIKGIDHKSGLVCTIDDKKTSADLADALKGNYKIIVTTIQKFLYEEQKESGWNDVEIDGMSGFIFCNRFGNVPNPQSVNRTIKRIIADYNASEVVEAKKQHREAVLLPDFSAHYLRHTFCTRLCEQETNLKVIQSVMGHKDIQTTMDIYAEATEEKKQESFERLAATLDIF